MSSEQGRRMLCKKCDKRRYFRGEAVNFLPHERQGASRRFMALRFDANSPTASALSLTETDASVLIHSLGTKATLDYTVTT